MLNLAELKATRATLVKEYTEALAGLDKFIAFMERREAPPPPSDPTPPSRLPANSILASSITFQAAEPRPRGFSTLEIMMIESFKEDESKTWTSRGLWEGLVARGALVAGRDTDAQINTVLTAMNKLAEDGILAIEQRGIGRRPTIFRFVKKEN
jgi:hypothetical protein